MVGTATVEVSGGDAARWAADLHSALTRSVQAGDHVSPVEVRRSAEVVIAVIALVFAGVETAKTIWDWQRSRKPQAATTVTIFLADGTRVDVSNVSQAELEILFQRALSKR